jgi:hypothetical protein
MSSNQPKRREIITTENKPIVLAAVQQDSFGIKGLKCHH